MPAFPPVYEAGGSVGVVGWWGDERENCRTGINCLLILYLVFAGRFDARYCEFPSSEGIEKIRFEGPAGFAGAL